MFYNPNKYQQRSVGATLVVAQNHDNKPETGQPQGIARTGIAKQRLGICLTHSNQ